MSGEDRFERWSPAYERSVLQRLLFDRVHAAIFLAAGSTMVPAAVLDVGCGTGRLLREAHRRWPDATVVGVDISPGMIAEARRRATYGQFVVGPAEHLPLESESVDLALSTMSFHHWTDKEAGVRDVARVLKTDGRFILADHAARWVRRVGAAPAPSARERIQVFTAAGLSVVEERSVLSHFLLLTVGRKRARPKSAPVEEPPAV